MNVPTPEQLRDLFREQNLFRSLTAVCEIPSPTFHEQQKIEYLAKHMQELGLQKVHIDATGNAIGTIMHDPSDKSFVLLCAHADTACEAPLPIRVQDDGKFLRAHSICDNSAGITALLTFLTFLHKNRMTLRRNYLVAFTVGEEGLGGKRGMKAIVKTHGKKLRYVINSESHEIGRITNACIGQFRARLTVTAKQKGAHSYRDFGEPNAVVLLSRIIADFSKSRIPKSTTYNVTAISGGEGINAIPDTAECLFECRSGEQGDMDTLVSRLKKILKQRCQGKVRGTLGVLAITEAASIPATHPLYTIAQQIQRSMGIRSSFKIGNTDGDVPLALGIPTITLGSSNGAATHSLDERLEKKTFAKGVEQVLRIILALDEKLEDAREATSFRIRRHKNDGV